MNRSITVHEWQKTQHTHTHNKKDSKTLTKRMDTRWKTELNPTKTKKKKRISPQHNDSKKEENTAWNKHNKRSQKKGSELNPIEIKTYNKKSPKKRSKHQHASKINSSLSVQKGAGLAEQQQQQEQQEKRRRECGICRSRIQSLC